MTVRTVVWGENVHEQTDRVVRDLYPDGMHGEEGTFAICSSLPGPITDQMMSPSAAIPMTAPIRKPILLTPVPFSALFSSNPSIDQYLIHQRFRGELFNRLSLAQRKSLNVARQ